MKTTWIMIALVLAAACGSDDDSIGIDPVSWCFGVGSGVCDAGRRCGYVVADDCEETINAQLGCTTIDAEYLCGSADYDGEAALTCIIAFDSWPCAQLDAYLNGDGDFPFACDETRICR